MIAALFKFDGRLNRGPFWGFSILLIAVMLVIQSVVLSSALGPSVAVVIDQIQRGEVPAVTDLISMFTGASQQLGWIALIMQVVFSYPAAALCVKRRHDRNRSGIDVWILIGANLLVTLLMLLGIGMTTTEIQGVAVPAPAQWMQLVQLAIFIFGVYLFIVLAFLKGTVGTNDYGPDPLQG
jgi:uncharacterized membrane protein YhaH (DUF805 family)